MFHYVGSGIVRIDLCFRAVGRKRQPNLASVFFAFILCCSIFVFLVNVCLYYVRLSFSVLSLEVAWEERLQNDLFVKP